MSITLKDGTVLPDIPADLLAEYPYAFIVEERGDDGSLSGYALLSVKSVVVFIPAAITGDTEYLAWEVEGYKQHIAFGSSTESWIFTPVEVLNNVLKLTSSLSVVWSNHDIMTVSEFVDDVPVIGTEIYHKSDVPPFVLPDGTELPALPVGCFEKGAYGVVLKMVDRGVETYILGVATQAGIYVPAEIAGGTYNLIHSAVEGEAYAYVPGTYSDWQHAAAGSLNDPLIEGILELKWSNSDILTATAKNDDGTYEIGSEIYHQSDVNYRIYGGLMQSLANEARRLGGVTGAMKPDVVESTLRGVTAGGGGGNYQSKTVTPSDEEQTVYPDSGYDALSSVTVEGILYGEDNVVYNPDGAENGVDAITGHTWRDNIATKTTVGYALTAKETVIITGLKVGYGIEQEVNAHIWTDTGAKLYEMGAETLPQGGSPLVLSIAPITMPAGSTFVFSMYLSTRYGRYRSISEENIDDRLSWVGSGTSGGVDGFPNINPSDNSFYNIIPIISSPPHDGEIRDSYQLKSQTLYDLGTEVSRISGVRATTVNEMISALKTVT